MTTGTDRGAGTSATVWLQLVGSECPKGTERVELAQDPDNFEPGRKDVFRLPGKHKARAAEAENPRSSRAGLPARFCRQG